MGLRHDVSAWRLGAGTTHQPFFPQPRRQLSRTQPRTSPAQSYINRKDSLAAASHELTRYQAVSGHASFQHPLGHVNSPKPPSIKNTPTEDREVIPPRCVVISPASQPSCSCEFSPQLPEVVATPVPVTESSQRSPSSRPGHHIGLARFCLRLRCRGLDHRNLQHLHDPGLHRRGHDHCWLRRLRTYAPDHLSLVPVRPGMQQSGRVQDDLPGCYGQRQRL
jgi:hypothetical protein